MRLPFPLLLFSLVQQWTHASPPAKRTHSTHDYYALEHNPSASATLQECTGELGVELVDQVGELPTVGQNPPQVREFGRPLRISNWFISTSGCSRPCTPHIILHKTPLPQIPRQRIKRDSSFLERAPPPLSPGDSQLNTAKAIAERLGFEDPLFTKQWHIVNDQYPEHMMNVTGVWEMGFTGEGVITSLVDDGLDYRSKDLASNFDADNSYDFNDHTDLPTPMLIDDHHGTRCAGQIAAVKNDVCGVGLAYDSKVAGVRILSGPISDVDEAAALNYGFQNVSIYSCSWGPPDDGKSMEAPGYIIEKAFVNGIQDGRGGKGSIFVFASGNGAMQGDQCNFDGYTNSIYSVTVSAVDFKGLHPYYSEPCAANMVVAYSSGSGQHIVTTDIGEDKCTSSHGGTSAAAPNAAGVFALALQARPDLTWRDIQHLCVKAAQMINPEDPDWEPMASGQMYSYKYGFGQLNAYAYIQAVQDWQLVKPQAWFHPAAIQINNGTLLTEDGDMEGGQPIIPGGAMSSFTVMQDMLDACNFEGLEHVTIRVWISHTKRGDVEVELTSPHGIRSVLAAKRDRDLSRRGFRGWRFMTIKHWGENAVGTWTLKVSDLSTEHQGTFHGWRLMFWGSTINPADAKTYTLPLSEYQLPFLEDVDTVIVPTPSSSKSHPKPTSGLPDDHGSAEGEASKPAFPSPTTSVSTTPTMTPTPDEGWFSDMSNLVSSQKWFFGAIGAVVLFGVGTGVFFWRRMKHRAYTALNVGDDLPMSSVSQNSGPRSRELYDAFGEVSDDEDVNEETRLQPGGQTSERLGFHSEFLDDDDAYPASPSPVYRDDPEKGYIASPDVRSVSPGSGSGDGSWEHASQTQ